MGLIYKDGSRSKGAEQVIIGVGQYLHYRHYILSASKQILHRDDIGHHANYSQAKLLLPKVSIYIPPAAARHVESATRTI